MNATKAYVTAKIEELLQEQVLEGIAGNPSFKAPDIKHVPNTRYIILIIESVRVGLEMVPNI